MFQTAHRISDHNQTAECYANNNLRVTTSLGLLHIYLSQSDFKGNFSTWLNQQVDDGEDRQVYINQWKATLWQSIHLSGKVANLSEMSIASTLQLDSVNV